MPSRLADDRSCARWSARWARAARGVYMLTKGSKTSIPYLEELAAEAKRPVVIAALFHSNTNPTAAFNDLRARSNAARARGHQLVAQTSCCPLSMDFTFKSPYLFESMQAWKPAMAAHDGRRAEEDLSRSRVARRRCADELATPARPPGVQRRMGQAVRRRDGEGRRTAAMEGATLAELARAGRQGRRSTASSTSPVGEPRHDLRGRSCCTTTRRRSARSWPIPTPTSRCPTPARISPSSATPASACTCSATGAASSACSTWPQAVHRLTGQPAKLFGIKDRGLLREASPPT